jgi:signal peptidase I
VGKWRKATFELALLVAVALGFALCVQAYAVKPYRIPSSSMEPTLHVGDRVLVNRFSHRIGAQPHVGEIVVFHPPAGADASPPQCAVTGQGADSRFPCSRGTAGASHRAFIKRVVAVAGYRIAIRGGHVVRNGRLQKEPFTATCGYGGECDFPQPVRVPSGCVFLMGDNRGDSEDSRFWGPVPVRWVLGKAVVVYWPPGRIGTP